jgi:hypothetical protein
MDWRRVIERFPSRLIEGAGFSVRVYERYGTRYYEHGRELSLLTGSEDATDRYGRSLLVFPTIETQIFVPNVLAWDDGVLLSKAESATVIPRICNVFEKLKRPFRVITGDEIYNQQVIDARETGNDET